MSPSANASAVAACTAAGSLPGASSPPVVLLSAAALLAIADEVLVVVALGNPLSTRRDSQKRRGFSLFGKISIGVEERMPAHNRAWRRLLGGAERRGTGQLRKRRGRWTRGSAADAALVRNAWVVWSMCCGERSRLPGAHATLLGQGRPLSQRACDTARGVCVWRAAPACVSRAKSGVRAPRQRTGL